MGQLSSNLTHAASLFTKYTPNYQILRTFEEEHYGEIKIVQDIDSGRRMFLKETIFETKEAFQEEVDFFTKRLQIVHPNIVQIMGFDSQTGQNFCSRIYKVLIFIELSGKDLAHELEDRITQDKPFSESTILLIAENLISALAYLQSHDLVHGDIRPRNIFASGNIYKLFDPSLSSQRELNGLARAIISREETFLSPEVISQVPKNQLTSSANKFKSDVFSLGITLLSLASLTKGEELYNYEAGMITNGLLQNRLALVKKQYSMLTYELIRTMLTMEESHRPDFEELQVRLVPYKEKIRQGRNPLASGSPSMRNTPASSLGSTKISPFEEERGEALRTSQEHASLAEQVVEIKPQKRIFDGVKKGKKSKGSIGGEENAEKSSGATTERKRIFDKKSNEENLPTNPLLVNILEHKEKPVQQPKTEEPLKESKAPLQAQDTNQSQKPIPQTPKSEQQAETFNFDYQNNANQQAVSGEIDINNFKTPFDDFEDDNAAPFDFDAVNRSIAQVDNILRRSQILSSQADPGMRSSQQLDQSRRNEMASSQNMSKVNLKMEEDPAMQYSYAMLQPHSEIIEHGENLRGSSFASVKKVEEARDQLGGRRGKELSAPMRHHHHHGLSKSGIIMQKGAEDFGGYNPLPTNLRGSQNFQNLGINTDLVNREEQIRPLTERNLTSTPRPIDKENVIKASVPPLQQELNKPSGQKIPDPHFMIASPRLVLGDVTNKNAQMNIIDVNQKLEGGLQPQSQQLPEIQRIPSNTDSAREQIKEGSDILSLNPKSALSEALEEGSTSGWFDFSSYEFGNQDASNENQDANKLPSTNVNNPLPQYSSLFPQTLGQESNLMNLVLGGNQSSARNFMDVSKPSRAGFDIDVSEIKRIPSEKVQETGPVPALPEINQNINQQQRQPREFGAEIEMNIPAATSTLKPSGGAFAEYPNLLDSGVGQMYPVGGGLQGSSEPQKPAEPLYNLLDLSSQGNKENYIPPSSSIPQPTSKVYLSQIPAAQGVQTSAQKEKEVPTKILDYSVKLSESFDVDAPKMEYSNNNDLLNRVLSDRPVTEVPKNVDFPLRSSQDLFNYGKAAESYAAPNIQTQSAGMIDDISFLVNQALARTKATMNQMRPQPENFGAVRPLDNNLIGAPKNYDYLSSSLYTSIPGYNPSHP